MFSCSSAWELVNKEQQCESSALWVQSPFLKQGIPFGGHFLKALSDANLHEKKSEIYKTVFEENGPSQMSIHK